MFTINNYLFRLPKGMLPLVKHVVSVDEAMKLMRSVQEMWGAYQRYRQEREHFVRLREDRDWWKTYLSIKE